MKKILTILIIVLNVGIALCEWTNYPPITTEHLFCNDISKTGDTIIVGGKNETLLISFNKGDSYNTIDLVSYGFTGLISDIAYLGNGKMLLMKKTSIYAYNLDDNSLQKILSSDKNLISIEFMDGLLAIGSEDENGGLMKISTDYGNNFTDYPLGNTYNIGPIQNVTISENGVIYGSSYSSSMRGIIKISGTNITKLASNNLDFSGLEGVDMMRHVDGILYVAMSNKLYESINDNDFNESFTHTSSDIISVFTENEKFYAVLEEGDIYSKEVSGWIKVYSPTSIVEYNDAKSSGGTIVIVGNDGLLMQNKSAINIPEGDCSPPNIITPKSGFLNSPTKPDLVVAEYYTKGVKYFFEVYDVNNEKVYSVLSDSPQIRIPNSSRLSSNHNYSWRCMIVSQDGTFGLSSWTKPQFFTVMNTENLPASGEQGSILGHVWNSLVVRGHPTNIELSDVHTQQCVAFVKNTLRSISTHRNMPSIGDAHMYFETAGGYIPVHNSGSIMPMVGSIICFKIGKYGHIGIVTEVGDDYIKVAQQNMKTLPDDIYLGEVYNLTVNNGFYTIAGRLKCEGWLNPQHHWISPLKNEKVTYTRKPTLDWMPLRGTLKETIYIARVDNDNCLDLVLGTVEKYNNFGHFQVPSSLQDGKYIVTIEVQVQEGNLVSNLRMDRHIFEIEFNSYIPSNNSYTNLEFTWGLKSNQKVTSSNYGHCTPPISIYKRIRNGWKPLGEFNLTDKVVLSDVSYDDTLFLKGKGIIDTMFKVDSTVGLVLPIAFDTIYKNICGKIVGKNIIGNTSNLSELELTINGNGFESFIVSRPSTCEHDTCTNYTFHEFGDSFFYSLDSGTNSIAVTLYGDTDTITISKQFWYYPVIDEQLQILQVNVDLGDQDSIEIYIDGEYNGFVFDGDHLFVGDSTLIHLGDSKNIITPLNNEIQYNSILSNDALESKDIIKVHPNPTTGIVHISGSQSATPVRITDLLGRKVFNKTCSKEAHISLNHLPEGIYLIDIGGVTKKIIVQH